MSRVLSRLLLVFVLVAAQGCTLQDVIQALGFPPLPLPNGPIPNVPIPGWACFLGPPVAKYPAINTTAIVSSTDVMNRAIAKADFNNDGLIDVLVGGDANATFVGGYSASPVRLFLSQPGGGFLEATSRLVGGPQPVVAFQPIGGAADFNKDGKPDIVLFDAGNHKRTVMGGYFGGEPRLYLSNTANNDLTYSPVLRDGVRAYRVALYGSLPLPMGTPPVTPLPPFDFGGTYALYEQGVDQDAAYGTGAELHLKSISIGDIDGDNAPEIWVESGGGYSWPQHGMIFINKLATSGAFAPDPQRVSAETLRNIVTGQLVPGTWRFIGNLLTDIDKDGDRDLVLGELRNTVSTYNWDHGDLHSKVCRNDGAGFFAPDKCFDLLRPAALSDSAAAYAIASSDFSGDGRPDLALVYTRGGASYEPGVPPPDWAYRGRYLQILIQQPSGQFKDETATRVGPQTTEMSVTTSHPFANTFVETARPDNDGTVRNIELLDLNHDGEMDLVLSSGGGTITKYTPIAYLQRCGKFYPFVPPVVSQSNFAVVQNDFWLPSLAGNGYDLMHIGEFGLPMPAPAFGIYRTQYQP